MNQCLFILFVILMNEEHCRYANGRMTNPFYLIVDLFMAICLWSGPLPELPDQRSMVRSYTEFDHHHNSHDVTIL